ncbi:MAG: metal-dependent hydrolase [Flavobacteriales bacterium]|nr:metal-dependent hydrolase [Flavobacteriales bacterium]
MKAIIKIKKNNYEVDFSKGNDISIPMIFNGEQPNTYNVNKAVSKPYKDGNFIGDTRKGGPCNFETYTLTPHCNGTHTECIGHITKERISILNSLKKELFASTLISIIPENSKENYYPILNENDKIISKKILEEKLTEIKPEFLEGLIIRTLPNKVKKKNRNYIENPPCFLSIDAMEYIVQLGVQHLLVDIPSVDRLFDDGILSSHNIFWKTKEKKFNEETINKTITEMIFVPNKISDGTYITNLQCAPFDSDASPSRPILYKIHGI